MVLRKILFYLLQGGCSCLTKQCGVAAWHSKSEDSCNGHDGVTAARSQAKKEEKKKETYTLKLAQHSASIWEFPKLRGPHVDPV